MSEILNDLVKAGLAMAEDFGKDVHALLAKRFEATETVSSLEAAALGFVFMRFAAHFNSYGLLSASEHGNYSVLRRGLLDTFEANLDDAYSRLQIEVSKHARKS